MRLTNKISVEFTPECSKVNPLMTQGKCSYYERLAEFENFMEEQGFENLNELKEAFDYIKSKTFLKSVVECTGLKQENETLKARWEKLKEYVKEEMEKNKDLACTAWYNADEEFLAKMKELEK